MRSVSVAAGHAANSKTVAIALGEIDAEPPRSRILVRRGDDEPFQTFDVRSNIVSITHRREPSGEVTFILLGLDGDVFFVGETLEHEHLQGKDRDPDDLPPSLSAIRNDHGVLVACGDGATVYVRGRSIWKAVCDEDAGFGDLSFVSVAATPARIVACGTTPTQHLAPTAEQQAALDRLAEEAEKDENMTLGELHKRKCAILGIGEDEEEDAIVKPSMGTILVRDEAWKALGESEAHFNDVIFLDERRWVAVGGGGTIAFERRRLTTEEKGPYLAVRRSGDALYVLANERIDVFDLDGNKTHDIPLSPKLGTPHSFDVRDGVIWCFDHSAVARYDGKRWELVDLAVATKPKKTSLKKSIAKKTGAKK